MRLFYNLLTYVATAHIWIAQFFSKKLRLFMSGRKKSFKTLSDKIAPDDQTIWFHCASLGEFEQGFPIMEATKRQYPEHKIIVSFFSPSGYEFKKDTPVADAVVYLPMDTKKNAKKFIGLVHPSITIFVKYEFWPNYLLELHAQKIPAVLVSGLFRKDQVFFKPYGGFIRRAINTFSHLFVQDASSETLVRSLKIDRVSISGDTRFDRVSHQIELDNRLDFMESFKGDSLCIVCGSTWVDDEDVLLHYINNAPKQVKFVIAPHKIDHKKILDLKNKISKSTILHSELHSEGELESISTKDVLIIDMIGLLTKIYSYADIAYVGGAMGKTGLHNILEPATFGVPIIIGENYDDFPEAKRLRSLAGLFSIADEKTCTEILTKLIEDSKFREKTGMISGHFINSNTGATTMVMDYISEVLPNKSNTHRLV